MMASIVRSRRALRDAAEIWHYIAFDNPAAADKLIETFDAKLQFLADAPGSGQDRSDLAKNLRSFPVGNYLIFYRPMRKGIQVVRILHGARDLTRLFRR